MNLHQLSDKEGIAKSLEYSNERVQFQTYAHVLEGIGDPLGGHILDAGCGWGSMALILHHCGARVYGIDNVKKTISELQDRYPFISWKTIDLMNVNELSFLPKFDRIVSVETLQYVDFEPVIESLWSHLNRGGRLVASVPNSSCPIVQKVAEREGCNYKPISEGQIINLMNLLPDVESILMKGLTFRDDQKYWPYMASEWSRALSGRPNRIIFLIAKEI